MKRLVICCDGTWNWPDQKGSPTNVVKMARAILPSGRDGVPQIVSYDTGVGTGNRWDRLTGGLFGVGLGDNVEQAYRFLVDNYELGDELFFFGFSRGAYTVRSLGGLIGLVGLLHKEHMDLFPAAWAYYRTPPQERTASQKATFVAKFAPEFAPRRARIECICVWDTVGTMGVPFGPLRFLGRRRYSFHNTNLGDNVAHAFQALAIDEQRRSFAPAVWRREQGTEFAARLKSYGIETQVLEQAWFPGAHSNVGGGYEDAGLSDGALLWMANRAKSCGLQLDDAFLGRKQARTQYVLVNSRTLKWRFLPAKQRDLCAVDESERVHVSALGRLRGEPPPFAPTPYQPRNLSQWLAGVGPKVADFVDSRYLHDE